MSQRDNTIAYRTITIIVTAAVSVVTALLLQNDHKVVVPLLVCCMHLLETSASLQTKHSTEDSLASKHQPAARLLD
eukprot:1155948-Pelagomonas_calceolata.AAC.2